MPKLIVRLPVEEPVAIFEPRPQVAESLDAMLDNITTNDLTQDICSAGVMTVCIILLLAAAFATYNTDVDVPSL